jgi:D-amino-acid oxidase
MNPIIPKNPLKLVVVGAGVVGLTTALTLRQAFPAASVRIIAKYFPGDKSIHYTSPWAGANWLSAATDDADLEHFDRVTYMRFEELARNKPECGLGKLPLRAIFDQVPAEAGVLSKNTGEIWYRNLVGGLQDIPTAKLPKGAVFGFDVPSTFVINVPVYLAW